MKTLKDCIGDYQAFLDELLTGLTDAGLELRDFSQIDHLCYRTISLENYLQKKGELSVHAKLLAESQINGRPIATFRLNEPIRYQSWRIDALELPAPKSENRYAEGLEHLELVLFDDFQTFMQKYEKISFDTAAINRGINPEISLQLGRYSAKFHLINLPSVVYLEQKLGLNSVTPDHE